MAKVLKVMNGLVAGGVGIVLVAGGVGFILLSNLDRYRPQITQKLSEAIGRSVQVNGPIRLSFVLGGVALSIEDVKIPNPSWAKDQNLLTVGRAKVGVGLAPLLRKNLEFTTIELADAVLGLESTRESGENWIMGSQKTAAPQHNGVTQAVQQKAESQESLAVTLSNLRFVNTRITKRVDGRIVTAFEAEALDYRPEHDKAHLSFRGKVNGAMVQLDAVIDVPNPQQEPQWNFVVDGEYQAIAFHATGKHDAEAQKIDVTDLSVKAGKSDLSGRMTVDYKNTPSLRGDLGYVYVSLDEFLAAMNPGVEKKSSVPAEQKQAVEPSGHRLFSEETLDLQGLKSVNAEINIHGQQWSIGQGAIHNLKGTLSLSDGVLKLNLPSFEVGASKALANFVLNAQAVPYQTAIVFSSPQMAYHDVLAFSGHQDLAQGAINLAFNLESRGHSPRDFARSMQGKITAIGDKASLSEDAVARISPLLKPIVGGNNPALNCIAARAVVQDGILRDQGVVADTTGTTVRSRFTVDLGNESIDMVLEPRVKMGQSGDLTPPIYVKGRLQAPSYSVDAAAIAGRALDMVLGGGNAGNAPMLNTPPAGQNACLYTLDHPVTVTQPVLKPSAVSKVRDTVNELGSSLKGLFGR